MKLSSPPATLHEILALVPACDFLTFQRSYSSTEDSLDLFFDDYDSDTRRIVRARLPRGKGDIRVEIVKLKEWSPGLKSWGHYIGPVQEYRITNQRGLKALREAVRTLHRNREGHDYMPAVWTHLVNHNQPTNQ